MILFFDDGGCFFLNVMDVVGELWMDVNILFVWIICDNG